MYVKFFNSIINKYFNSFMKCICDHVMKHIFLMIIISELSMMTIISSISLIKTMTRTTTTRCFNNTIYFSIQKSYKVVWHKPLVYRCVFTLLISKYFLFWHLRHCHKILPCSRANGWPLA